MFIEHCMLRSADGNEPTSYELDKCLKIFFVTKFFTLEYFCYRFELVDQTLRYDYQTAGRSFMMSHLIYIIYMNTTTIKNSLFVRPIAHGMATFPFYSLPYAPLILRQQEHFNGPFLNYRFDVGYSETSIYRLPSPYPTKCTNYQEDATYERFKHYALCIKQCTTNFTMELLGKVPFQGIISEPIDVKHVSPLDLENKTTATAIHRNRIECDKQCPQMECVEKYKLTKLSVISLNRSSHFLINLPREPSFGVYYKPALSMSEFLIYISSCVGAACQ